MKITINIENKIIQFPRDFKKEIHPIFPNSVYFLYYNNNKPLISIIGGEPGMYGDGIDTFEMWDYREEYPRGYQTKLGINQYLLSNPIMT